jgi:hypothetical protein
MPVELIRHQEPLNEDELFFLKKKLSRERSQYFKLIRILMILCFVCPYLIALGRAVEGAPDAFSYKVYFLGVFFLLAFSGVGVYFAYYNNLRKVRSDIRHKTKTIERAHIVRKQYMSQNNCFYFYIDSPNKLSIEVNELDYNRLDTGDEVNIEYTSVSRIYLGYY